jgi:hypothetical protein
MSDKPNLIVDLTFGFSLKIIRFTEELESKKKFNLAINYSEVEHQLALMYGKHKVRRVKLILGISVK